MRQVVGAVREREVEVPAASERAHRAVRAQQPDELPQPRCAAVAAERRVRHAVQLEQLQRLRVVARR